MSRPGLAKCVVDARAAFDDLVEMYEARVAALESDVTRLEIENASLWTSVHELQAIAERAYTGTAHQGEQP